MNKSGTPHTDFHEYLMDLGATIFAAYEDQSRSHKGIRYEVATNDGDAELFEDSETGDVTVLSSQETVEEVFSDLKQRGYKPVV